MVESRASIGVKHSTKELLTYVSAQVQSEVERGDITWDEFLIYLAIKYLDNKGISFNEILKKLNIDVEEFERVSKRVQVMK